MTINRRNYALGTRLDCEMPFSLFIGGRAMCADGRVRTLKRISSTADTFFSVPAAVEVRRDGKRYTVAGYVTVQTISGSDVPTESDPAVLKFRAYTYRKNHAVLTAERDAS